MAYSISHDCGQTSATANRSNLSTRLLSLRIAITLLIVRAHNIGIYSRVHEYHVVRDGTRLPHSPHEVAA